MLENLLTHTLQVAVLLLCQYPIEKIANLDKNEDILLYFNHYSFLIGKIFVGVLMSVITTF